LALAAGAQPARWQQLTSTAAQLAQQGKFAEALPPAQEALRAAEAAFGPESPQAGSSAYALQSILSALFRYSEAWPLARRALDIDQKTGGPETAKVAADFTALGEILLAAGKGADAESMFSKAFAIDGKIHGPQDPATGADLLRGGQSYLIDEKNVEAEKLFRRAIEIDRRSFGEESAQLARDYGYLAQALSGQGKLNEASSLFPKALKMAVQKQGPDHPDVALIIDQMGAMYQRIGRPWDAAKAYETAAGIDRKKLGPNNPTTAMIVGHLAAALEEEGDYDKAFSEYQQAIVGSEQSLGKVHPQRARQLTALGVFELQHGHVTLQQACLQLQEAAVILAKTLGREHPAFAEANGRLAECYGLSGDYARAIKGLNESIAADTKALGPNHPAVAEEEALLGSVMTRAGQFAAAEDHYARALAIDERALGPDHPKTQAVAFQSGMNYFAGKKPDQAEPLLDRSVAGLLKRLEDYSFYMSEGDRLRFLKTAPDVIPSYFYFGYVYPNRPGMAGNIYKLALTERGLAASSAGAIRARILSSGDKELIARFDALTEKKRELSAIESSPSGDPAVFRANLDKLQTEVNRLEEALAYYSPAFASKSGVTHITWDAVQKALQPGEAAVEYLRFAISEKGAEKGFYEALVLTKDAAPKFVPLGDAVTVEKTVIDAYESQEGVTRGVSATMALAPGVSGTKAAYDAFWKPIESALIGAKRVYVAADGILNQFPIGLLSGQNGKILLETYDLRLVNSTRDIVNPAQAPASKSAVVMGNPSFDLSEAQQRAALAKVKRAPGSPAAATQTIAEGATRGIAEGKLPPLPGTQGEVEAVAKELGAAGWQVTLFTKDSALEETLMAQHGPRLVHLATHGFFLPDKPFVRVTAAGVKQKIQIYDPMLRSGLFFAGADRSRAGETQPADLEDGVLTAFEATQLDLQGTELVVLSACETGRGKQDNGEGVFGLRRALQEAGAQSVLMSMWSVPDQETRELMGLFYKKWLAGADKQDALRQAQLEEREVVRKRYAKDLPFYWGAFVLVGR
jgi:CHAT domain-containing protein/tetratricopeptide (TPR) repeat protein